MIEATSSHDCDLDGGFVSFVKESVHDAPFCLAEVGVYTTINIASQATVYFNGTSDFDSLLVV